MHTENNDIYKYTNKDTKIQYIKKLIRTQTMINIYSKHTNTHKYTQERTHKKTHKNTCRERVIK